MSAERIADEPAPRRPYIWTAAALEAELETGRREESERAAEASLLVRVARISAGSTIALLGLLLLLLPGPGLVVLVAGLSILAIDVPFARRLLQKALARMPQDADGTTPRWFVLAAAGGGAVAMAASVALLLG